MSAIVFLDIDGVLNTKASYRRVNPSGALVADPTEAKRLAVATLEPVLVARLQHVCDGAGADVVIVSGWRRFMTLDEMRAALEGTGLTAPVLDAVGGVKFSADLRQRGAEEWLAEHPEVTRAVVLDDTRGNWRGFRFPVVSPEDGITADDVVEAEKALEVER